MNELQAIAEEYEKLKSDGIRCALATVVRVTGSSYRKPGARMLVAEDGRIIAGCISGGCLERDVAEHAVKTLLTGISKLLTYDTLSESSQQLDRLFGLGTGCEGIIEILVEPLNDSTKWLEMSSSYLSEGYPCLIATVFESTNPGDLGTREVLRADQKIDVHQDDVSQVQKSLAGIGHYSLQFNKSQIVIAELDGSNFEVYFDYIRPTLKLVIYGNGMDVLPLEKIAQQLDWRVNLVDPKTVRAQNISIDSNTAVAIMTHNYDFDRQLLSELSGSSAFYVGLLGSRKRLGNILNELQQDGIVISKMLGHRFHAPIGLDLGDSSPDVIVLSIMAQIQAEYNEATAEPLSDKSHNLRKSEIIGQTKHKNNLEPEHNSSVTEEASCPVLV